MEERILIRNFNQFYGKKQVLFDFNLDIERGIYGLLGKNGAGKTTFMKTLATLLPLKEGEIEICGIPLKNVREIRRRIGYLPQDFSMYPSMRVGEALDYLGVLSGMERRVRRERAQMLLEKVNLADQANKKIKTLSGGMRQRLGIAQALLHDPKVLIVDEPTAGLDPGERIRFRSLLEEVARERIVLLSTHIVGDIEASCGRLAILSGGRLLFAGTAEELLLRADGKVYEMTVRQEQLDEMKRNYAVLSIHAKSSGKTVRFLSDVPVAGAVSQKPVMEDAYLQMLCEYGAKRLKGGNGDAFSEGM